MNGSEKAREAGFGIAGGREEAVIFVAGEKVATVPEDRLVDELFHLLEVTLSERAGSRRVLFFECPVDGRWFRAWIVG